MIVVHEAVTKGGGCDLSYLALTKTICSKWSTIMRVQVQGVGLWDVIDTGNATERQALGAILCFIPSKTDAYKAMHVGFHHLSEARR
jgi:hypothetical protein